MVNRQSGTIRLHRCGAIDGGCAAEGPTDKQRTASWPGATTVKRFGLATSLDDFLANEAAGGLLLMAVAALALVVANSPLAPTYFLVLDAYILGLSVIHWINDALMAGFFLLVGLEIKREVRQGQLRA